MYCYPQEIMLSMIICSNYQNKEHITRNTQSNPSGLTMPLNSPQKSTIIIVWIQALMWNIFVHIQNGLAKSLNKRITYLIDHYHRIAVNIMLASYSLTHCKFNSNSYNCNQSSTPVAVSTWNLGLSQIFPICVPVTFYIYRYHHRSIHPWALRIHIRYLSVIHKISWITHKD